MGSDIKPTGWGGTPVSAPNITAIQNAAQRLKNIAVRTPLIPLHSYKGRQNIYNIYLKPENLQPIGSYKIRGAYNWAASLTAEERSRGFSTVSADNTAMAVGFAARAFDVPARSLLPDSVPVDKLAAIERYGVQPIIVPMDELFAFIFKAAWDKEPYCFLNPWADQNMMTGSATIGLEIFQDMPDVETVYVPVGGGGLISGIGSALKILKPSTKIIGVQSDTCPSLNATLEAGKPTWVESKPTICDGTAVPFVTDEMYPLLKQVVDRAVLVSEESVENAIRRLCLRNKLIVEGSGALSVAAALAEKPERRGKTVCILSGSSIDSKKLINIISQNI
jgi:threonine dehydratase